MSAGRRKYTIALAAILVLLILFFGLSRLYLDWLWFQSLNYSSVFTTILFSQIGIRLLVAVGLFIFFFVNLLLTRGVLRGLFETDDGQRIIRSQGLLLEKILAGRAVTYIYLAASIILALIFSSLASGQWELVQKFIHASSFGIQDPLFHLDIGFYVFKLPLYQLVYKILISAIIATIFVLAVIYFVTKSVDLFTNNITQFSWPKMHFLGLIGILFLVKAWGYKLGIYNLLNSPQGVIYGAGYTDMHANLLAMKVFMVLSIITGLIILFNIFSRKLKLALSAVGLFVAAWIVLALIYPGIMQKFVVEPNEFNKEKVYIENNIKFTKLAYGLDEIERQVYSATEKITLDILAQNENTVKNIRLWDWRPYGQTVNQLQGLRPYYEFVDVDIDRYLINGQYRQVMLSARELDQTKLPEPAMNWINQRLKYTHGYGAVISPVNEITSEGLPKYFVKDIPPAATTDLQVTQPRIYFGERTNSYVFVNTDTPEFDYPQGSENAYTTYSGNSGVTASNLLRRVSMAVGFGDYKILFANDLNSESRVLYYRNIHERVAKIAPFLRFDQDPYLVVDGDRLVWIQDAYTVTDMFPYAEPTEGMGNYIRNSVKIVIDAYTGKTTFYVTDKTEPIIRTYMKIFPGMFTDLEKMPESLRQHVRYPEDMFTVQSQMYTTYHMSDPRVFFNKEDKWNLANEMIGSEKQTIEPYYTIIQLPGSDKPEFILMIPFTPLNKDNMVSWMAARSDGDAYGKLLLYEFSKQQTVYGPMQVEARIDQDSTISQQLTLWNQRGSNTFRGNLMVLPINNALVYVEPLYLQSEQSKLPELRRVIVVYEDKVVMEETLEAGLKRIFEGYESPSGKPDTGQPDTGSTGTDSDFDINRVIKEANTVYLEAQKLLQSGDWAGYGNRMNRLEQLLKELDKQTRQ